MTLNTENINSSRLIIPLQPSQLCSIEPRSAELTPGLTQSHGATPGTIQSWDVIQTLHTIVSSRVASQHGKTSWDCFLHSLKYNFLFVRNDSLKFKWSAKLEEATFFPVSLSQLTSASHLLRQLWGTELSRGLYSIFKQILIVTRRNQPVKLFSLSFPCHDITESHIIIDIKHV